jgi:SAM-dependent methyltransferase
MTAYATPAPSTRDAPRAAPVCRVCGSADCVLVGPPAYRRPPNVAGVPIEVSDLELGHYRCRRCGYGFVHPPIPEDRLLDCYRRAAGGHWTTGGDVAAARNYARKRDLLERHAPGRRVLDFGCYDGGFLVYLGDGWDRAGVEPAAEAAAVAASRGVKMLGPTIESVDPSSVEPFHAVVVFDVMEHLNRPVETLAALGRLTAPGGVVLVETGNSDSWPWRHQRQHYPYCGLVEHVGFFNRSSIEEAGKRAGFQLTVFEESVHTKMPASQRVRSAAYNLAYRALRAAGAAGLPLSARARDLGLGPFPRSVHDRDHFLAVLKKA